MKDRVYSEKMDSVERFRFNASVVDVFPDMINRSVPGYETMIGFSGIIADRYIQPQTNCYDLGCSLGASSFAIANHVNHFDYSIIAVDNSPEMTERFAKIKQRQITTVPIDIRCMDVMDTDINNASFAVMNFTLQFIAPELRDEIIKKIYAGLNPGGALMLSEKIIFDSEKEQSFIEQNHYAFKKSNGYSELEISQKRSALENVLIAETISEHLERFKRCGFAEAYKWYQCLNFVSFVAVKY